MILDGIDLPRPGEAFELVAAAIAEPELGRVEHVADAGGDENLAGSCQIHQSRRGMHSDTADAVRSNLDLADVVVHAPVRA